MLKVRQPVNSDGLPCIVATDYYIPLKFAAYKDGLPGRYLWQCGDGKETFLEARIDRNSHLLMGVTLTAFAKKPISQVADSYFDAQQVAGLPCIDISGFNSDAIRADDSFSLAIQNNGVYLIFNLDYPPNRCIRHGRMGFFDYDGQLCGVGFLDLTSEELSDIENYLSRSK